MLRGQHISSECRDHSCPHRIFLFAFMKVGLTFLDYLGMSHFCQMFENAKIFFSMNSRCDLRKNLLGLLLSEHRGPNPFMIYNL